MKYLLNYNYPGNIRELKNIIERMVVLSADGILRLDSLNNMKTKELKINMNEEIIPFKRAKQMFEIQYIKDVLSKCDNNITKAANYMGLSRRQLFNKLVEYNLKK